VTYHIEFSKVAIKSLNTIPKCDQKQIKKKIDDLASTPYPQNCKKIEGTNSVYRIRSGDYRILYSVFDRELIILIVNVGHRRDIYQKFTNLTSIKNSSKIFLEKLLNEFFVLAQNLFSFTAKIKLIQEFAAITFFFCF
jgi:mRNA interferase RelE/StbE